jgi:nucleoside-diphosphate-sugar epimerase
VSPVGALWVVASRPAFHTGCMAGDAVATTFITGADGSIGTELVKVLTAPGHQVFGLTRSIEGAQRVRRAGVEHSTTRDWLPLSLSHARARASKFSEHSMSTELCRLATTSELGQSFDFDEVVLPHIDAG